MFPFLVLIAVAVACMGMLNSLRSFFLPALAPAAFNVACIASAFVIVPFMPALGWHAMVGLAIGTLLGGVAQVALLWPALIREGFRFRPQFGFGDPRFREIVRLMIPGTLGLAAAQVNQLVNAYPPYERGEGASPTSGVPAADMPADRPVRRVDHRRDPGIGRRRRRRHTGRAQRRLAGRAHDADAEPGDIRAWRTWPGRSSSCAESIRSVTAQNTAGIAAALMGLRAGSRRLFRGESPRRPSLRAPGLTGPVTIGMVCIVLNVVLNLVLVRTSLSYAGLALGTGIAAIANALLLFWMLRRRLAGLDDRRVITSLVKVLLASSAMAAVAWGVEHQLAVHWAGHEVWRRAIRVGLAISLGLGTLALTARLLRLHEFQVAFGRVWGRVAGRLARRR